MGLRKIEPKRGQLFSEAIVIERVTNLDDYLELENLWNDLLSTSSCEAACLHWKWMQLWWQHFARPDFQPIILLFHQADELVAIFPLVVIPVKGSVSLDRVLYFFGTGENEIEEITTEYIDIIALPGFEQAVAEAAARYLTAVFTHWDRMELMRYCKTSVLQCYFLPALQKAGVRQYHAISGFRHYIPLGDNYDDYVNQRSRSFRKNIKTHSNRLKALGKLEVKTITTKEEIDWVLNSLRELHLKRFEHLSSISAFTSQRFTDFHRDLIQWLYENNQLLFQMYVLDGKVIAAEYNFIFNNTVYAYQGSFDTSIKHLSPGFLSINEIIKTSIAKGVKIYDFMMGGEVHYASIYGCKRETIYTCYAYNRSIRSRLAFYWLVVKRRTRGVRVVLKEVWSIMKLMV